MIFTFLCWRCPRVGGSWPVRPVVAVPVQLLRRRDGGSRTAKKSGAVAVPWCTVVPSVDQSGRAPGGLVGCAARVVASAIRSRPVVLASYSAVSASATSVELGTLCPGWEAARPTLIVSTACGLTPRWFVRAAG